MTKDARERLLDRNEQLCREYNLTDDPLVLEEIAMTEVLLLGDPDRILQHQPDSASSTQGEGK